MHGTSDRAVTFVSLLQRRAASHGQQTAYTFLEFQSDEITQTALTYARLDLRARVLGAQLQAVAPAGSRVLLLYRPGPAFIAGFLGSLYAGMVAVTVGTPRLGSRADRLASIVDDAQPSVILSTTSVRRAMQERIDPAGTQRWICDDAVDDSAAAEWRDPLLAPEDVAFLQYSSGSTGRPKGVKLTHGNLAHQSAAFHRETGATRDSCFVSWLPTFHDLGLIAGVLQPLYGGYHGVLMAPEAFVEEPYRWLQAITDYRADISGAPNFAYELCLSKITPAQRATLDLSAWRFALNGAEPVRGRTIDAFAERFAPCGFRRSAFYPAYGLAESTLLVSGGSDGPLRTRRFNADALEQDLVLPAADADPTARALVGSALPVADQQLLIVNPITRQQAHTGEVGEIWLASPSVAAGYWNSDADTAETFDARLTDPDGSHDGPYLRTGDLGFVHERELFICGRLKDLILVRGRKHHAPDIELTAENSHPALRSGCGVAFSVEVDDVEQVVVAYEIDRQFKADGPASVEAILLAIRRAVAEQHQLQLHAVVLLRHGTMPKTSSGKLQRRECRARYLDGQLKIRAAWPDTGAPPRSAARPDPDTLAATRLHVTGSDRRPHALHGGSQ